MSLTILVNEGQVKVPGYFFLIERVIIKFAKGEPLNGAIASANDKSNFAGLTHCKLKF